MKVKNVSNSTRRWLDIRRSDNNLPLELAPGEMAPIDHLIGSDPWLQPVADTFTTPEPAKVVTPTVTTVQLETQEVQ